MTSKLLIPCVPVLLAAAIHAAEIEKRVHRLPPPGPERDCFYTLRWPSAGDLGPRASFGPIAFDSKSPDDEEAGAIPSPEERFAAFIREHVAPEILEQEGGSVEVEGKSIVVTAPPAVHERIAHLLEMLAPDELLVHVDMALVPTGALPEGSVVGSELAWETIARALEKGGKDSAGITIACRNGEAGQTFAGTSRRSPAHEAGDHKGYPPVTSPGMEDHPLGFTARVEPLILPRDRGTLVEFHVTRLALAGASRHLETPFTRLELETLAEDTARGLVIAPPGKAVIASTLRVDGLEGARELSVAVRATPERSRRTAPGGDPPIDVHDLAFLQSSVLGPKLLEEVIRANVLGTEILDGAAVSFLDRKVIVTGPDRGRAAAAEWLSSRVERQARRSRLSVHILEGPSAAILEATRGADGIVLRAGWKEAAVEKGARAVISDAVQGIEGSSFIRRSFRAVPFIDDVSSIHDGCFGPGTLMPLVDVEKASTGVEWTGSVSEITAGLVELELDFLLARMEPGRGAEVLAPADIGPVFLLESRDDAPKPRRSWLWLPYTVDLPRGEILEWEGSMAIPSGRPVLLRAGESGEGRSWLLAVEAEIDAGPSTRTEEVPPDRELQVFDTAFLLRGPRLGRGDLPESPVLDTREIEAKPGSLDLGLEPPPLLEARLVGLIEDVLQEGGGEAGRVREKDHGVIVEGPGESVSKVHALIERLERALSEARRIDTAIVPAAALDSAAPGWRAPGASPWLDGAAFERALEVAGREGRFLTSPLPRGTSTSHAPARRVSMVRDDEVNHTGWAPVLSHFTSWEGIGAYMHAGTPDEAPSHPDELAARIGEALFPAAPERRRLPGGDLDLHDFRQWTVRAGGIPPSARTLVLGASLNPRKGAGRESFAVLVRVDPARYQGKIPPAGEPEEEEEEEEEEEDDESETPEVPTVRELPAPRPAVALDLWDAVAGPAELGDLSGGIDPARLADLEKGECERVRLAGSAGAELGLVSVSGRSHVTGVEMVADRLGTQILEVPDLEVSSIGEGVSIRARVTPSAAGHARLVLEWGRNGPPRVQRKTRAKVPVLPRGDARGNPVESKPEDGWIDLDLPEVDEDRWKVEVTAPLGRPVLLRAAPAPGDGGRMKVTIVRVDVHEP